MEMLAYPVEIRFLRVHLRFAGNEGKACFGDLKGLDIAHLTIIIAVADRLEGSAKPQKPSLELPDYRERRLSGIRDLDLTAKAASGRHFVQLGNMRYGSTLYSSMSRFRELQNRQLNMTEPS